MLDNQLKSNYQDISLEKFDFALLRNINENYSDANKSHKRLAFKKPFAHHCTNITIHSITALFKLSVKAWIALLIIFQL